MSLCTLRGMPSPSEREAWKAMLVHDGVAGPHRSHSHHNNLGKLRRTIEGDPDCPFGVSGLEALTMEPAMAAMADVTGWRAGEPTDYAAPPKPSPPPPPAPGARARHAR